MENSGKRNPETGFKSPPEQKRPPKVHALQYFLRASQPRLNIISLSRPLDSPKATYAPSSPIKGWIPASQLLHASKIAGLPRTNFFENTVACEPLCIFLYFYDPAIRRKFDAKAVK